MPARAAAPTIAILPFTLDNTSPAPSTSEELARTARMSQEMATLLAKSGDFTPIATTPVIRGLNPMPDFRLCNGCELPLARKLGATLVAYGWVQKVSNLILNLNVVIEDVKSGKMVAGGSVDIRGNTDDSWHHGLDFLVQEHVLPREPHGA